MQTNNAITWITGASSGIGRSITLEFTANENLVAASARSEETLERMKKEIEKEGKNIEIFPLDIKDSGSVAKTFKTISSDYQVECLINNAGATSFKLAQENNFDEIKEIIDTNLLGAIYAVKNVLPHMIENKRGTIINILSVAADTVFTKSSAYAASKAGLQAYSKVLREEVREHNIKVINILPGATRTPIWPNDALEKYGDRMMSPMELAKLVYYINSIKSNLVAEEITIRPIKGDL